LLPLSTTVGFVLLGILGMLVLPLFFPQITMLMVVGAPLSFVLLVSVLILLSVHHRNKLEAMRQVKLLESENRFRKAVFAAPFPVMLHAEDGEVLALNRRWMETTGYTADDIPTVAVWAELAHADHGGRFQAVIAQLFEDDILADDEGEMVIQTKRGERRTWHVRSSSLGKLPDGRRFALSMAVDVTERKQVEEQLAFQSLLLDQIGDMVTAIDLEGYITYANEAERRTFGDEPETLVGRHVDVYDEHFVRDLTCEEVIATTQAVGQWRGEEVKIDKDDHKIVVDSRTQLIHDAQGAPVGILKISTDITDRKRVERALRRERDLLYTLMDNIPDTIYFKDTEGRFTLVNAAQAEILGIETPEEAMGKTDFDYFAPDHAVEAFEDEQRIVTSGEPVVDKVERIRRADGEFRWVSVTKVPITASDGTVTGIVGISRDITERKRAEDALRRNKALFESLVQSMPQNVFSKDLEGRFTFANQSYCELQGLPLEEIIGKKDEDLHPPDLSRKYRLDDQRVMETGETFETVEVHQPLKGEKSYVQVIKTPIYDAEGEVNGLLGMFWDITERREMEQQLQQQARLAAVGQLAAGIAHDFRNLLSTIILYAQLPMRSNELPAGVVKNLQTIVEESYRATDLVQQILDFSSRAMIEPQALDLSALTEKVHDMLDHTLPEHIRLSLDVEDSESRYVVRADPGRIQQALTNLALNARDAMPGGGDLRLSLSLVDLRGGETPPISDMGPGSWICLAVSDTGTGMTEEVLEHIFEPFFTTKDVGKGSGLGLAQVYGIVRQHDGYIDVASEVGEGTTFFIYLPAHVAGGEKEAAAEKQPTPSGQNETILLVEDEAPLREAGQKILASLGYKVLTAANGREALAKCQAPRWSARQSGPVDLVITDLVMPVMGGKDLLRALKSTRPKLPVMAITGYALQGDDVEALRALGFEDVLFKPLEIETWAQEIRQILDR
jgi:PAS domain S-box-containing protein